MKVFSFHTPPKYDFPEDMSKIMSYLNSKGELKVVEECVEAYYKEFSVDVYCAYWVTASDSHIKEFAEWLSEKDLSEVPCKWVK